MSDPISPILQDFARKLTELNDRQVRLTGGALSLEDPRDIAGQILCLAESLGHLVHWDEGGTQTVDAIAAQCIAFRLARARVDELDPTLGDGA
jgi:hypothetical protein